MYAPYPNYNLSERDLRSVLREPRTSRIPFLKMVGALAAATFIGVGGFYLVNLAAFKRLNDTGSVAQAQISASPTPVASSTPAVAAAIPAPAPTPSIPDNTVSLSDVGISAPISWDTPFNAKVIAQKLQDGVIHIAGTAKPGQQGTVVITGHSSNYAWAKGSYNDIFAPLHKVVIGQEIDVAYQGTTYVYKVTKTFVVHPTQLEVLNATPVSLLRLITCTPVGTSKDRLVIEAQQISPNPASNTAFTQEAFTGSIPAGQ